MDSETSADPLPHESAADLLAEVEATITVMGLANIPSATISLPVIYEHTNTLYERILMFLPSALRTMTRQQELTLWGRLAHIRQWLESTALRLRVR